MLVRRPLGHRIADQLRAEILSGELENGSRLTQDTICARFDTSRIPARDAVQILSYEGLLRATSSGIVVTGPTNTDLEEMLRIESALHVLAIELATERASDESLSELMQTNQETLQVAEGPDVEGGFTANHSFHRTINHLADSSRLLAALRANSVRSHWSIVSSHRRHVPGTADDHTEIVRAMVDRDRAKAASLMADHMARINEAFLQATSDGAGRMSSAS
jgi:DNA-binding GntR family transcriptional regulator